jgi:hypothetical protein
MRVFCRYSFDIVILVHEYEQDKIYGNETSDFTNNEEFTEEVKDCYRLNEVFALCIWVTSSKRRKLEFYEVMAGRCKWDLFWE